MGRLKAILKRKEERERRLREALDDLFGRASMALSSRCAYSKVLPPIDLGKL